MADEVLHDFARQLREAGGETASLIAARDWQATPLGPMPAWPASLRTALGLLLLSPVPMVLLWGEDGVMLYNDAYSAFAGARHPALLGSKVREGWPEVADFNDNVMRVGLGGGTLAYRDQELTLHRHGRPERVSMNLDYSPVPGEDGRPAGVLAIVIETTGRVAADRLREAAEVELRAERDRARGVLDNMGEAFALLDRDLCILDLNAEALRMEARPRAAVLGLTHAEAHPHGDPEVVRLYGTALAEGRPVALEHRYVWPDGRESWLDLRAYPVEAGLAVFYRDVTARRAADDARREGEERLRLVIESATDYAILTIDPDMTVATWSAGAEAAFGYAANEIVGRDAAVLFTPEDRAADRPDYEVETARREGVAPDVRWHQRRDGSRVFLNGTVRPLRAEGGRELGFIKIARDETERRRAEDALRESEAQFRAFAQAVPNHVWAARPDGALYWFNEQVYAYTGEAPGTLDGAEWGRIVHPDDLPAAATAWAHAVATGEVYATEFRIRRADGAFRWFLVRAEPVRADGADGGGPGSGPVNGAVAGWVGTNTDIDDRRRVEADLRELAGTLEARVAKRTAERDRLWTLSEDMFAQADFEGMMSAVSPAWTRVLGWSEAELLSRPYASFMHPDDMGPTLEALGRMGETGRPARFENRIAAADGTWTPIEWMVASEPDGANFVAVGRDLSGAKAREAELEAAQEALRQSQKMEAVGQLTSGIAHDFNNLLTGVIGSLDMIQKRAGSAEPARIERYVTAAATAANRAAALTHRLLAFSRRQPLDPRPVNANRLVTGMEELLRRTLGEAVRLEIVTAGGLWQTHCDPHQLESAILNLAINARDALPGGGTLTIETGNAHLDSTYAARSREVRPGQYVCVCVTDTGAGMTPEVIGRAFEPFFTTKPIGQGTGLGLSMVYGFARQSEGFAKIYSEVGRGTTVKLYLPRHYGDGADAEEAAGRPAPEPRAHAGEVVLVVEDEVVVRDLVVDVLEELGYRAVEAVDGPAGLKVLGSGQRVDLLVTDIGLPGLNGRQLADAAREARPGLKVLFMTGYAENATRAAGFLQPGMQMITKPFAVDALAQRIRQMIEAPADGPIHGRPAPPSPGAGGATARRR